MSEEKAKLEKSVLESELGEKLGVIRPSWQDIAGRVLQVSLDIGYYRGRSKIQLREMGLENAGEYTKFLKQHVSLGHKYLLPKKSISKLEHLESQARSLLVRRSFATPIGYLAPIKGYRQFRDRLEALCSEFMSQIEEIATKRDHLIDHMRAQYAEAARAAYKASRGLSYTAPVAVPESFIEDFITRVISCVPSADEIRAAAKFEVYPNYIEKPSELAEELLHAERIEQERQRIELETRAREMDLRAKEASVLEVERLKRQAERERLRLEQEIHTEIVQKQAALKKERIEKTIDLLSAHLRETILNACQGVLHSIGRNNNRLVASSARRLWNLVKRLRMLNFNDDASIESYLSHIEDKLTYRKTERGVEDIKNLLTDIGQVVELELVALGTRSLDDPVSFLELGVDGIDSDEVLALKERLLQPVTMAEEQLPLFELPPLREEVYPRKDASGEVVEVLLYPEDETVGVVDTDKAGV